MTDRYQHLMHLTPKQLQNHLVARGVNEHVRREIYDIVTSQQERRANSKRRAYQVSKHWDALHGPLTNELRIVRSMLLYGRGGEERIEVLRAYKHALQMVLSTIHYYKILSLTPKQAQDKRIADGKKPYPNNLTHWSDLVPERIKQAITDAFASLPYKPKAKRKIPFMRNEPEMGRELPESEAGDAAPAAGTT